ncbi:MAG: uroporphyrinogen-III C-methyltransferase [Burkholderiales bacterium]|nr:uroporphyrinogen-III C-methyltransferase [Burkholderiales bacterium]
MTASGRDTPAASGTVYLVGAGPGAPDLLTLRAARLLADADIVFHDALVHPETVALAQRAQKIAVGKRCGRHSTAQPFINTRLVDAARRFCVVVRLKGGDPMLFGRAQEEIAALEAAGIPCEVVPGITAALAAAAELKTSLTQRGSARSITFATPRVGIAEPDGTWAAGLAAADAGAIYMGAGEAERIARTLLNAGKAPGLPVAVIESASLPEQRIRYTTLVDLPRLAGDAVTGPALILMGPQFHARNPAVSSRGAKVTRDPRYATR